MVPLPLAPPHSHAAAFCDWLCQSMALQSGGYPGARGGASGLTQGGSCSLSSWAVHPALPVRRDSAGRRDPTGPEGPSQVTPSRSTPLSVWDWEEDLGAEVRIPRPDP